MADVEAKAGSTKSRHFSVTRNWSDTEVSMLGSMANPQIWVDAKIKEDSDKLRGACASNGKVTRFRFQCEEAPETSTPLLTYGNSQCDCML